MHGLKLAAILWSLLAVAALGGCIDRPNDEMLRPPPKVAKALGALEQETARSSRRIATEAQNQSRRLAQRSARVTGPVLAQAIRHAEVQASRSGAKPIPAPISKQLSPYFDQKLLGSVHWTLGQGRFDLGTLLTRHYLNEGAVTLNGQVVFTSERLTRNVWIWAHELAHVEQYRRLGVNRFAAAYITDWQGLEREATKRANTVTASIRKAG